MAMAFDAVSHGDNISIAVSNPITFAHTIGAGSNMTLEVLIHLLNATNLLTSVTYNGTAMTLVQGPIFDSGNGDGASNFYRYTLANPTVGTNNIVVTFSTTVFVVAVGLSYSGASATQPDGLDTGTASNVSTSDITGTITTTTAGDWGIMMVGLGRGIAASTGSTLRYAYSNGQGAVYDSGAAFGSTGTNTMAWHATATGGGNYTYIMSGVKAAGAAVANSKFLMFM